MPPAAAGTIVALGSSGGAGAATGWGATSVHAKSCTPTPHRRQACRRAPRRGVAQDGSALLEVVVPVLVHGAGRTKEDDMSRVII
jgi:hypothetical protein